MCPDHPVACLMVGGEFWGLEESKRLSGRSLALEGLPGRGHKSKGHWICLLLSPDLSTLGSLSVFMLPGASPLLS